MLKIKKLFKSIRRLLRAALRLLAEDELRLLQSLEVDFVEVDGEVVLRVLLDDVRAVLPDRV